MTEKTAFEHLQEISSLFDANYRRYAFTRDHPVAISEEKAIENYHNLEVFAARDDLPKELQTEVHEAMFRYQNGLIMRIPLNQENTQQSPEYFWLAPTKWCHDCQITLLSWDLNELELCRHCGSFPYTLHSPDKTHIGFPNCKKFPYLDNLPGCYKNANRNLPQNARKIF